MRGDIQAGTTASPRSSLKMGQALKTIMALFKLRVVFLLLFAAVGGAFLGAHGIPSISTILAVVVTGTLAAGGASAINQYLEQQSDTKMRRTHNRPLANGQIKQTRIVLGISIAMILVGVISVLPTNPAMSFYLALGALIYVGVYTIWLKPRSVVNIVIGGAAGSCAVMTGGAAVGAASDPGVISLALLVFLWTPAHFWALAMFYKDDYAAAGVPMLPVNETAQSTTWWIFIHAAGTGFAALVLGIHPALGLVYLIPAGILTMWMMISSVKLIRSPERKQAIKLFVASNVFLALVLLFIIVATAGHQLFS